MATALDASGVPAPQIISLAVLVQADNAKRVLTFLRNRPGVGKETLYAYAALMRTIARHWVPRDDKNIAKLEKFCKGLAFAAEETKQRVALEFTIPQVLTEPLKQYPAVHRPALLQLGSHAGTTDNYLWVARDGGRLGPAGITDLIKDETKTAFGESINPHLVRDCVATTIAIDHPEHAQMIAPLLGHSSMATSEMHYNHAGTIDAGRQYQAVLAKTRQQLPRNARADRGH